MSNTAQFIDRLVPITQFNRGQASRIFDRLKAESQLVVLRNNQPAAVILSPQEYRRLSEMEEDYQLLLEASRRLNDKDAGTSSMDEVMRELGVTEDELQAGEDGAIE